MKDKRICHCDEYPHPHRFGSGKCDGYSAVDKIFSSELCQPDCPYLKQWMESRGEFWGVPCSEPMAECEVLESTNHKYTDCPALDSYLTSGAQHVSDQDKRSNR